MDLSWEVPVEMGRFSSDSMALSAGDFWGLVAAIVEVELESFSLMWTERDTDENTEAYIVDIAAEDSLSCKLPSLLSRAFSSFDDELALASESLFWSSSPSNAPKSASRSSSAISNERRMRAD